MSDTDEFCEVGNPRFWEERAFDWKQRAETAEAENARLKCEVEKYQKVANEDIHEVFERAEAAEAEGTRLREALQPFGLFASAVERCFDLDKHLEVVVTIEHQSLVVGAFITARQALIDGER